MFAFAPEAREPPRPGYAAGAGAAGAGAAGTSLQSGSPLGGGGRGGGCPEARPAPVSTWNQGALGLRWRGRARRSNVRRWVGRPSAGGVGRGRGGVGLAPPLCLGGGGRNGAWSSGAWPRPRRSVLTPPAGPPAARGHCRRMSAALATGCRGGCRGLRGLGSTRRRLEVGTQGDPGQGMWPVTLGAELGRG